MFHIFDKEKLKDFGNKEKMAFSSLLKWCIAAAGIGVGLGFTGVLFYKLLHFVTELRLGHTWMLFFTSICRSDHRMAL